MTTKHYVDNSGSYLGGFDGLVPAGGIEVSNPPPHGLASWNGIEWIMPAPTSEDVNTERERRVRGGFIFNNTLFDFGDEAKARISGAATLAGFALGAGSPDGYLRWHQGTDDFAWIAADNSLMTMDAKTCFAFGQAAATHDSKHVFAARELKNMEPIPEDFRDDKWWPVLGT
jgi:hypothetical protein